MTMHTVRTSLRSLAEAIRRFPEILSRSLPLAAAPMGMQPLSNWRDYDFPTFKRRGIRLSITQETARH